MREKFIELLEKSINFETGREMRFVGGDVVPVVRSKDCKGMNEDKFCIAWEGFVREDDFCHTEKGKTMYQSPITLYGTAVQTIIEQRENAIFAKVQSSLEVDVDKAELIRALQYDRGQYDAGYRDGKVDAAPKWIPVSERLPKHFEHVLLNIPGEKPFTTVHEGYLEKDGLWNIRLFRCNPEDVTHWMPLPEPPTEGKE